VLLAVMIYNPGPSFLSDVRIRVTLPTRPGDYANLTTVISSINALIPVITATATINIAGSQTGCVEYVPGSTCVTTTRGPRRALPDGIVEGGVSLGDIDRGLTRFVLFRVKIVRPTAARA
jgi:hypothetical protein